MDDFLLQAYRDTTYQVVSDVNVFKLKINTKHSDFNAWCKYNDIKSWAFITAYNPLSEELSKNDNIRLNSQLEEVIVKNGYEYNYGYGVPADDNWEAEASFFIQNITLDKAKELGNRFNQNAIVFGELNALPQLVVLV